MPSNEKFSTPQVTQGLALVLGTVWLVALVLALTGLISASTAAGLAVGALAGVGALAVGTWLGLRRAATAADAGRLDALEPLPPRER